jgi:uncharacterized Zn-finger protein
LVWLCGYGCFYFYFYFYYFSQFLFSGKGISTSTTTTNDDDDDNEDDDNTASDNDSNDVDIEEIEELTTKKYVCPYCKQAFDGGGHGLSDHFAHMRTHKELFCVEERGMFKCRYCSKALKKFRVLYEHVRMQVRIILSLCLLDFKPFFVVF